MKTIALILSLAFGLAVASRAQCPTSPNPRQADVTYGGVWMPGTTYKLNEQVTRGGTYIGKTCTGNVGHDPLTDLSHTYWDVVSQPLASSTSTGPTPAALIQNIALANILANRHYYNDGTSLYNAAIGVAPVYQNQYITDTTLAMVGKPDAFKDSDVINTINKFLGAVSNTGTYPNLPAGSIPQSLNAAGVVQQMCTGFDAWCHHPTGDGWISIPQLEWLHYQKTGDLSQFAADAAKIDTALAAIPLNGSTGLPYITAGDEWVGWGFYEYMRDTGYETATLAWYYNATNLTAQLYGLIGNSAKQTLYAGKAAATKTFLGSTSSVLWDSANGMYKKATAQNTMDDVLGSSLACHLGIPTTAQCTAIGTYIATNAATLVYQGYIKNIPGDFTTTGSISSSTGGTPYGTLYSPGCTSCYQSAFWSVGLQWELEVINGPYPGTAAAILRDFVMGTDPTQEYYAPNASTGFVMGQPQNMESPVGAAAYASDPLHPEHAVQLLNGSRPQKTESEQLLFGATIPLGLSPDSISGDVNQACIGTNYRNYDKGQGAGAQDYAVNPSNPATRICTTATTVNFQTAAATTGALSWTVSGTFTYSSGTFSSGGTAGYSQNTADAGQSHTNMTVVDFDGAGRVVAYGPNSSTPAPAVLGSLSVGGSIADTIAVNAALHTATSSAPFTAPSLSTNQASSTGTTCTIGGYITLTLDGTARKVAYCN